MPTAAQIILATASKLGVTQAGQALEGDDVATCFRALNLMLDSWRGRPSAPLLAWQDTETVFTLPDGTASRTIGPGQQVNVTLPGRIEMSSFVRIQDIDYPLRPVDENQFNRIALKTLPGTWPTVVNLQRGAATGVLRFWPQGQAEVHLVTRVPFLRFADLTTNYPLAPGYESAMVYNLALEVADDFSVGVPPRVAAKAVTTLRAIKGNQVIVPQLDVAQGENMAAQRGALFGFAQ